MKLHGRLTKWNDQRGYGFITDDSSGEEVFVHISAFPHNTKRPEIGEVLSFDIVIDTERNSKRKAVNLKRLSRLSSNSVKPHRFKKKSSFNVSNVLGVCTLIILGFVFYPTIVQFFKDEGLIDSSLNDIPLMPLTTVENTQFRCDGRQHCSQMNSRAEAVFFIRNCPNTKMDGDNDGEPCENDSRF